MQATASASRLESELLQHDAILDDARGRIQKAATDAAMVNEQLERLQEKARLAQKVLGKAEGDSRAAKMKRTIARDELAYVMED